MVSVMTGFWLDYSEPSTLNATITLPIEYGTLLLSALTVMVGFAGASFWNILAFFLHSCRINEEQALAIELQQQVSLRNTSGSASAIWQAFKIHRAWTGKGVPNLWRRTFSFFLPAVVVWAGFTTAGIFTSRVANKGYSNTVARLKPNICGTWSFDSSQQGQNARNAKATNDTIEARTYMTKFYANTSSATTTRSLFFLEILPFSTNKAAPCPIPDTGRCILGNSGAFGMTTDPLDSHKMLGINAKPENRITVQINATCSPIDTTGLTHTTTDGLYTYRFYDLGPEPGNVNYTYRYNLLTVNMNIPYILSPYFAFAGLRGSWIPSPEFNRTDADVSVYFLTQNSLTYTEPVDDPWFLANGTYQDTSTGEILNRPNNYVNTMICTEQYTYCNPTTGVCTPPAGINGAMSHISKWNTPGFNPAQRITAGRINLALTNSNMHSSVIGLGANALFANNFVFAEIISTGLPHDQWRSEVLGWFQTSLAKLQAYVIQYAFKDAGGSSPYATVTSPYNIKTNDSTDAAEYAASRDQCTNQLVQVAGEVQNFSFLGVMIIVSMTVFLVILDWTLESIVELLSRHSPRGDLAVARARQADNSWHLLRMAIENTLPWELGRWNVPVLNYGNARFARPHWNAAQDLTRYSPDVPMENGINDNDIESNVLF